MSASGPRTPDPCAIEVERLLALFPVPEDRHQVEAVPQPPYESLEVRRLVSVAIRIPIRRVQSLENPSARHQIVGASLRSRCVGACGRSDTTGRWRWLR